MTNKEINRLSGRVFQGLLPPDWAFRSQEDQEDYGIDGEIEITTPEDKATGFVFKLQLKGTEHAIYDESGQLVYADASVERFSYYVQSLKVPVVFVVCDVLTKQCFWTRVQGQPQVEKALKNAVDKRQQTFTLKIPRSRTFDQTAGCASAVVESVASAMDTITLRSLTDLSGEAVCKHLADNPEIAATEKKFRLFAGMASTEAITALLRAGDIDSALKKAQGLLESKVEEPPIRIQAGVMFANAIGMGLRRARVADPAMRAARYRLGVTDRMLRICRLPGCDRRLRFYVRAYARGSRLQVNARLMLALAVSESVQRRQGETLAGPITTIQRIQASARVTRDFRKIWALLQEALERKYYSLLPYIVDDWLEVSLPFLHALRLAEQTETAKGYAQTLWKAVPLSVEVAKVMIDPDTAIGVLKMIGLKVVGLSVNDVVEAERFITRFEAELLGEKPISGGEEIVRMMREILSGATEEAKQKPSTSEVRAYYEQQAAALGINLDDPNDRIAEVVRIGLADLDPTRVARNCQHIHLRPGPRGIPAEILGLPSAGFKSIICLKHGHSMQGLKLDDLYEHFSRRMPWANDQICCETCLDRTPQPEGWNWSEEWAFKQEALYKTNRSAQDEDAE